MAFLIQADFHLDFPQRGGTLTLRGSLKVDDTSYGFFVSWGIMVNKRHNGAEDFSFPFIVGCDRSGTTLLRAMLDSHPNLAIPGESHFIVPMYRQRLRYESSDGFNTVQFLKDLSDHPRFQRWDIDTRHLASALEAAAPRDLAAAIQVVFRVYAEEQGKPRYGDKTPEYVLHLNALAKLFPHGRFIHVIRDGRDTALSLLDVDWGPRDIAQAASFWKTRVETGRDAGQELGSRYLEVHYEQLVAKPSHELRRVCAHIALPFTGAMLRYPERSKEISRPIVRPVAHRRLSQPPTKGLRDWAKQMPHVDVEIFEAIAGKTLSAMGYERLLPQVPFAARFRVVALYARARVERIMRRATTRSVKARRRGVRGRSGVRGD